MSKGIIIQARYSATRLPGKLLMPFHENQTILDIIINNIKEYAKIREIPVVLATTENIADDTIVKHCEKYHFLKIFRGSEENVLDRFIQAAKKFDITEIIRVCADNPFVNIRCVDDYFMSAQNNNYDYISYFINENLPVIKSHFGFWPEYVKLSALESVNNHTVEQKYKEHVTVFLYENPNKYNIGKLFVNERITQHLNIRLTVDTEQDFLIAQEVYFKLLDLNKKKTIENIMKIATENTEIIERMERSIYENTK